MSEKKIRGAVIGVTDDGYPIVTEDYSCPYFTGTSRSMPAVRECWYCRYADFRKSTKLQVSIITDSPVIPQQYLPLYGKQSGYQVRFYEK